MKLLGLLLCLWLATPASVQQVVQQFNVHHVQIVGNTVLSPADLAAVIKPYEGHRAHCRILPGWPPP